MISIDTNVLLRRLLRDDEAQTARVDELFARNSSILVTDIALCEALWTLTGPRYRITRKYVEHVVVGLISDPQIVLEDTDAVWGAINDFVEHGKADFADALIINKSRRIAENLDEWGSADTYTFDKGALEIFGAYHP